ncbi:MAG: hypothetical protein JNM89_13885 [Hyphomicrobiaceae bacterium]|nr:hypothetical protein [Hyphomicrobiaceae bacterium]
MIDMMTVPSPRPRTGAGYIVAWIALGLAAAAYLAALSVQPDFMPDWMTRRTLSAPQGNQGQRATTASDENAGRYAASDVAALRNQVAEREARIKTLELRVSGLEQDLADARQPRVAGGNAASPAAGVTAGGIEIVNASPIGIDGAPLTTAAVDPPLPSRRPDAPALRPSLSSPIETGSVASPATAAAAKPKAESPFTTPITFGAPEVKPAARPNVGVRLTTGPSIDALRLSWSLMTERFGADLTGLEPRYVAGGPPSAPFALIAGPVAGDAEARSLCAGLLAKGMPCVVDTFTGNAL